MLRGEISKRLLDAAPQFHYRSIQNEAAVWKQLLHVHAQIFASYFVSYRKGVCVQRWVSKDWDPHNGNFLGILELISHYDQILGDHFSKVKESQQSHRRLQVHYLSAEIQNEFINCVLCQLREASDFRCDNKYQILFHNSWRYSRFLSCWANIFHPSVCTLQRQCRYLRSSRALSRICWLYITT